MERYLPIKLNVVYFDDEDVIKTSFQDDNGADDGFSNIGKAIGNFTD